MGLLTRTFVPRSVRRATHPVRTVKRAATPRVVKQAQRSLHPVSNAVHSAQRPLNTKPRKRAPRVTAPAAPIRTAEEVQSDQAQAALRFVLVAVVLFVGLLLLTGSLWFAGGGTVGGLFAWKTH